MPEKRTVERARATLGALRREPTRTASRVAMSEAAKRGWAKRRRAAGPSRKSRSRAL